MLKNFVQLTLFLFGIFSLQAQSSSQVKVEKTGDKWQLMVNGRTFEVKGATFGYSEEVENYKHYKIKLKKLDLSCIRSGLVLFSSSNGFPHEIYLDEVVFE